MKVLATADTIGGVWTYTVELASALARHDVQLAVAAMGHPLTAQQWTQVRKLPNLQVFDSDWKLEWMDEPWPDVQRSGQWLLELERRLCPDVIHLCGYAHGALPLAAPILIAAHSCVLSWWKAVKGEPAPRTWERYRQAVRDGLRAADLVVAPTRAMLRSLTEQYGDLPRARVIANAADPARFHAAAKEPFILSAGRLWDEAKNIAALERAASGLEWPVYLAGEEQRPGDPRPSNWRTRSLGRLSPVRLRAWMARAAIYAHPARYEPFGLAPLEAALSGCALVVGDIPSLREVWADAALFVAPDNHAQLAAQLHRLIADPALRQTFADRARRRAAEYCPQRLATDYLAAYRYVLARHRGLHHQPAAPEHAGVQLPYG